MSSTLVVSAFASAKVRSTGPIFTLLKIVRAYDRSHGSSGIVATARIHLRSRKARSGSVHRIATSTAISRR